MNLPICSSYPELLVHKSWRWNVCNTFIYSSPFAWVCMCVCVCLCWPGQCQVKSTAVGDSKKVERNNKIKGKCAAFINSKSGRGVEIECSKNACISPLTVKSALCCGKETETVENALKFAVPDEVHLQVLPFVAINGWMPGDWHLAESSTSSVNSRKRRKKSWQTTPNSDPNTPFSVILRAPFRMPHHVQSRCGGNREHKIHSSHTVQKENNR